MKDYSNISYLNVALRSLVREEIREHRMAIESEIWSRYNQIHKILDGGRDILALSTGDSFDRLYVKRYVLWAKSYELLKVIEILNKVF